VDTIDALTLPLLIGALATFGAIIASFASTRFSLPAPAVFLAAGIVVNVLSDDARRVVDMRNVAQVGTIALVLILFEGGFGGGWRRMRGAIGPVLGLGIVGTFATTALLAAGAHLALHLSWQTSVLIAVALAPTDPAAVFSILGSRDVRGRSSAIIEGESGANDPVGIALMTGALAYYAHGTGVSHVAVTFLAELVVGAAVGAGLGAIAARVLRRATFTAESLFPLATIATAFVTFAVADLLHGRGFLAVLVAGLVMGDALHEHRGIRGLVALLAAVAEIVMFTLLGLVVVIGDVVEWFAAGLVLFVLLTVIVRPIVVALLLARVDLTRGERVFIGWGGLKGAVPVLLAALVVLEDAHDAAKVFAVVFVAVAASVLVQGSSIPWLVDRLSLGDAPGGDDA
jgi:cell volume regulation protein A